MYVTGEACWRSNGSCASRQALYQLSHLSNLIQVSFLLILLPFIATRSKAITVNVCLLICSYTCQCPWRPEEDPRSHESVVTGSYEPAGVGAGKTAL